jgi:hypothetical protein
MIRKTGHRAVAAAAQEVTVENTCFGRNGF